MQLDVTNVGPNVQRIAVGPRGSPGQYPPNVFLITGDSRAVFVDTAYGKDDEVEAALGAWRAKGGLPVAAIVLSHRHEDHVGGAARLREATGGDVVAAADERDGIEKQSPGLRIARRTPLSEQTPLLGTGDVIHVPSPERGARGARLQRDDGQGTTL